MEGIGTLLRRLRVSGATALVSGVKGVKGVKLGVISGELKKSLSKLLKISSMPLRRSSRGESAPRAWTA